MCIWDETYILVLALSRCHLCWGEQVVVANMVRMAMCTNLSHSSRSRARKEQNLTRWVTSPGANPSLARAARRSSLSQGERVSTNTTNPSPIWQWWASSLEFHDIPHKGQCSPQGWMCHWLSLSHPLLQLNSLVGAPQPYTFWPITVNMSETGLEFNNLCSNKKSFLGSSMSTVPK